MKRRVVITGMGAISPIGNTAEEMWQSARDGRCGIGPITHFDTSPHKVKLAGEVKDLDVTRYIDKREARRMDLFTQYAMVAAIQAYEDSGIVYENIDPTRFGVDISSGIGGINTVESEYERGSSGDLTGCPPSLCRWISATWRRAMWPSASAPGECAPAWSPPVPGGTNAIGDAFRMIRDGYLELVLAGGSEAAVAKLAIGGSPR